MADKDIEITTQACREFSDALDRARKSADDLSGSMNRALTGVEKLEALYKGFKENTAGFIRGAGKAPSGTLEGSNAPGRKDAQPGFFWFLEKEQEPYNKARKAYQKDTEEWYGKLRVLFNETSEERISLASKEYSILYAYDRLHEQSVLSRSGIETKAYKTMQDQLLKLVETHRFSAREFGKAIAQQVKVELTGIAARAAVWAIYETAMGFKELASQNYPGAALHFKSAAEFGAVAGVSMAAAAGVQQAFLSDKEDKGSAAGEGQRGLQGGDFAPVGANSKEQKPTQHITIKIYNPLSEQNWAKIVEENIVPALNSAGERNIALTIRQA